jgi:hypothetical protein
MSLYDDIRVDLGDLTTPYHYSDSTLQTVLEKSARRINRRLSLFDTDSQISIGASGAFTPNDGSLQDIVLLQAECLLITSDFSSDLNSGTAGVQVVDGEQSIDTRNKASARQSFFDSKHGPCAELEKAIRNEELRRSSDNSKLIW